MEYSKWENFHKVIKRAMISCENAGRSVLDQFPEVRNLVEGGVAPRSRIDYELTRYACYLIVQNGDPRKEVIALGQTYFAIQTYRQEWMGNWCHGSAGCTSFAREEYEAFYCNTVYG